MIERIKDGLWYLRLCMEQRRQRPHPPKRRCTAPLKGNMRSVVVVKPENAMFSEAVFILSDEYLREHSPSADEILSQAREVVATYAARQPESYGGGKRRLLLWMFVCVSLAAFCMVFWYFSSNIAVFCPKA